MQIIYDTRKDAKNREKHDGISLALAADLEWETCIEKEDTRRDYGEIRVEAIGYIGVRLHVVIYVLRPPEAPVARHIISLRKANTRERKRYDARKT